MPVPAKAGKQHVRGGCRPPVRLRLRLRRELDPPGGGLHPPPAKGGTPHRIPANRKEGLPWSTGTGSWRRRSGSRSVDRRVGGGVGWPWAFDALAAACEGRWFVACFRPGYGVPIGFRPMVSPTRPAPTGLMPCPPDRAPRHAPLAAPVACTGPEYGFRGRGVAQVRALIEAPCSSARSRAGGGNRALAVALELFQWYS